MEDKESEKEDVLDENTVVELSEDEVEDVSGGKRVIYTIETPQLEIV